MPLLPTRTSVYGQKKNKIKENYRRNLPAGKIVDRHLTVENVMAENNNK